MNEDPSIFEDQALTLSISEMQSIYQKLSAFDTVDFDVYNFLALVESHIFQVFDEKIIKMETLVFQQSDDLLNTQFVKLLKHLLDSKLIRKNQIGFVFIEFCSFFGLDECVVYKKLHHKLQLLIRNSADQLCDTDMIATYKKRNANKQQNIVIRSIFDL